MRYTDVNHRSHFVCSAWRVQFFHLRMSLQKFREIASENFLSFSMNDFSNAGLVTDESVEKIIDFMLRFIEAHAVHIKRGN